MNKFFLVALIGSFLLCWTACQKETTDPNNPLIQEVEERAAVCII
ncbi:MAG: hypothetical protein AB8E82_01895 [Aureispira sp.]